MEREMLSNSLGKESMERERKGSFPAPSSFLVLSLFSVRGEDLLAERKGVEEEMGSYMIH